MRQLPRHWRLSPVRACEKLRARGLVASGLWIFAHSDTFRPELPQHAANRTVALPAATSDTMLVLGMVRRMLRGLLQEGIGYKKAGVALLDLARPEDVQQDLFAPAVAGDQRFMNTLDQINRKFGRGVAALGWALRAGTTSRPWACGSTRYRPTTRRPCTSSLEPLVSTAAVTAVDLYKFTSFRRQQP